MISFREGIGPGAKSAVHGGGGEENSFTIGKGSLIGGEGRQARWLLSGKGGEVFVSEGGAEFAKGPTVEEI